MFLTRKLSVLAQHTYVSAKKREAISNINVLLYYSGHNLFILLIANIIIINCMHVLNIIIIDVNTSG